jgi:hypothetical protein
MTVYKLILECLIFSFILIFIPRYVSVYKGFMNKYITAEFIKLDPFITFTNNITI